jgi:hypothetical protein
MGRFEHHNIKNAVVMDMPQSDGSTAPKLILAVDIDERGSTKAAREVQTIAQEWLADNPTGSVQFDHV